MAKKKKLSQESVGLKYGFRSRSEKKLATQLVDADVPFEFESRVIHWIEPEKARKYTPDFILQKRGGGEMIIECKGRWVTADRLKHKHLKKQYPDLDIRFVFDNPNQKLYKGSKTTYAKYCEKNGFVYSPLKKEIPAEWLEEIVNK